MTDCPFKKIEKVKRELRRIDFEQRHASAGWVAMGDQSTEAIARYLLSIVEPLVEALEKVVHSNPVFALPYEDAQSVLRIIEEALSSKNLTKVGLRPFEIRRRLKKLERPFPL